MTRLVIVAAASIGLILFVAFIAARLAQTRTRGLSIRMQVFLALAAVVGAFALGLGVMVIDRIEARAVRFATQAAEDEATVIASMITSEMLRSGISLEAIARDFGKTQMRRAHLRVELRDGSGRLLYPESLPPEHLDGATVAVEHAIASGDGIAGAVRVVKPTLVMRRLLADFAPTVLVISLVLGAAAGLAAAWIGRAIAAPVEALTAFSERVSRGETTAPPPMGYGREVTRLSVSIDSMRRQLEGRPFVETFAADLSHELKNPVAAIRASAEVLPDALEEPEQARRFVARIREATDRIERLLRDLLSLASIEARGVESFAAVDFGKLVEGALQSFAEQGGRLQVSVERDTRVRGDAGWLGRAATNLIDNGLVHSERDAPVTVAVRRSGDAVELSVRSRGSISEHVRQRAFSRFVTTRADKGGTGLGLAIVRAVAEAHGGRAEITLAGPPVVEARLVLPAARARGAGIET